jgi:hypothetical protein
VAEFAAIADRKRARDSAERKKPAGIIAAQLRWIADECQRDAELMNRADIAVLRPDSLIDRAMIDISALR